MRTHLRTHTYIRRYGVVLTARWDEADRWTLTVHLGHRTWRVWR